MEEEAHAFARLDLEEARRLADPACPEQLLDLIFLNAHLSFLQGGLRAAAGLADEALRIAEAGASGADIAKSLVRIGDIKRRSFQAAEALEMYEAALRHREATLGPEHPRSQGLRDFIENFDISEPDPGALHEEEGIQQVSARLGGADMALLGDRLDLAESELREALNDAVCMLGRSHPATATVLKELASVLGRLGHHQDARKYLLHYADIVGEANGRSSEEAAAALALVSENAAAIASGHDRGPSHNRSIEVVLTPEHLFVWLINPDAEAQSPPSHAEDRSDCSGPQAPKPAKLISGSISGDDYPAAALRAEATGTCVILVHVGTSGRADKVEVERSSGDESLDSATCNLVSRRFRYDPARDGNGQPIASRLRQSVRWQLPDY
jgi:TonB family protein